MPRLVTKISKGAAFTFEYRVELSLDERNILKRVDALEHRLVDGGEPLTVSDLAKGQTMEFSSITDVLEHERRVRAAAVVLRDIIESLRALGAERVVVI